MGVFGNTFGDSYSGRYAIFSNNIDYSQIIHYLNILTDTSDTIYIGNVPTINEMNTILNTINGEII